MFAVVCVWIVSANFPDLNINVPSGSEGDNIINLPPTGEDVTAPPTSDSVAPTSLTVSVEPNPIEMGDWLYADVASPGKDYPITLHALYVGSGDEATVDLRLSETGRSYYDHVVEVPGYVDVWASCDNGVVSNRPRVTIEGAMLTSSKLFWSSSNPFGSDPTTTLKLYCHSSGTALIFVNDLDAGTSEELKTVYINSGGYATTTFDISTFSNGYYEIDFIVNGIKASDFDSSVVIQVGR